MRSYQIAVTTLASLFLGLFRWAGSADMAEEPAARWVSVYGWNQTGDRLAAAEQWALAMGSYIESFQQIKALAAEHPAYEPELIAYRTAKLEETITTMEERLSSDEHETMMKYLDFIESLELGLEQRFSNQYEESLSTLDMTRSLLDDLIRKKPPAFREAIHSQYLRVEDNIQWLSAQIDYKAAGLRRTTVVDGVRDWGTTRFVRAEDLPSTSDGGVVSAELFPSGLALINPGDFSEGVPVTETSAAALPEATNGNAEDEASEAVSGGAIRFRMNSTQKLDEVRGGLTVKAP